MNLINIAQYLVNIIKYILYYGVGNLRALLKGVKLGVGARVSPFSKLNKAYFIGAAIIGSKVRIGEGTYINSGVIMSGEIGSWCSIGYNVLIGPSEHDPNKRTTSPRFAKRLNLPEGYTDRDIPMPIIEDEVWIGAGVIVLRGARIGKGAIVAAGAVVVKDIPPYEIWGGVPARYIKKRDISIC